MAEETKSSSRERDKLPEISLADREGFDRSMFKREDLSDFECTICTGIMRDAVEGVCGHTLCDKCASKCKACPVCNGVPTWKPSYAIRAKINGLDVLHGGKTISLAQYVRGPEARCVICKEDIGTMSAADARAHFNSHRRFRFCLSWCEYSADSVHSCVGRFRDSAFRFPHSLQLDGVSTSAIIKGAKIHLERLSDDVKVVVDTEAGKIKWKTTNIGLGQLIVSVVIEDRESQPALLARNGVLDSNSVEFCVPDSDTMSLSVRYGRVM